MLVKIVGPSPLMSFASLSIIARDADTKGAISICWAVKPRHTGRRLDTHFVDHEEVGMGDTGAPLTRNLISALGQMESAKLQVAGVEVITATSIT